MSINERVAARAPIKRSIPVIPAFLLLLGALVLASVAIGAAPIPLEAILDSLFGRGDAVTRSVVFEIRLPRALLAVAVGAVYGMAGAALQGYLRNPLAEPYVLGASSAAALGGVIALYFGIAALFPLALPLSAILAAVIAIGVVLMLAHWSDSGLTLVLAGIGVGTLSTAAISLALNLSPNPFAAMEITTWLLGSLEDRSMKHVMLAVPFIGAGMILLLWDRRALDALSLGEETAETLGFSLDWVRLRLALGVALGVGAAVAVSGAIGFVGLVVPHILRPLIGPQPSRLLLPSALGGGILLAASDILVRLIPTANELKLGVVTAFLGVPFFFALLFKSRRGW